ncbi:MAG: TIGR03862 family flavoprotein [Bacteroidia bacterium]|nr:TIGR03862 family flavoprotein [Bacteroidia bacterium]
MKKTVSIIGGGPCALMLGAELDHQKYRVRIYEKNNTLGRKFLVAGDGGLNLTHSESPEIFLTRYTPSNFIARAFHHFSNLDFIKWLNNSGIETFVGSSKRVFPKKGIKPIQVLELLAHKVFKNETEVFYKHEWIGFSESKELLFNTAQKQITISSDIVIFCLGGASWPVTGSTGSWLQIFRNLGINVNDFQASNCSYKISWPEGLISSIEGKALKNIITSCNGVKHYGEVVLTRFGIEGSGIYPLGPQIRKQLQEQKEARVFIDLKPSVPIEKIEDKIRNKPTRSSLSSWLAEELKLNKTMISLLKWLLSKDEFLDTEKLAETIKNLPILVSGFGPIEDAISTVGGINLDELNENFELLKRPGIYAIGEMLDYDAPTGGYLLQSCFSMGKYLADYLNKKG